MAADSAAPAPARIRLWDWPVRLVHWAFALLIPAMWWTAEEGMMERHSQLGMLLLVLLVFRLLWGLVGSESARFASFVKGPGAVIAYLRGAPSPPGHSPLGALSVAGLLTLLAVQIGLGLFAQDVDALFSGPLNPLVSYESGDAAREWHERSFNLLAALIAVHLLAIGWYQFGKRDNLVGPMLTGNRRVPPGTREPARGSALAAALCLALALGFGWWIWSGAPPLGG
jgi:cytochrome b